MCDGPDAHAALQELLITLKDVCQRVNDFETNPGRAQRFTTTLILGDRLKFSNQVPKSVFLQLLGQVHLCGCLHVSYRSKNSIKGSYVISVLFDSTLVLANADEEGRNYFLLAGIPLANATVMETDNGKGLQCYTAPHSWKLVFEHSARMFEIIMTACSSTEAEAWRRKLGSSINLQAKAVADGTSNVFELHSPLTDEMRSVGKAFGKPGSFARRMSVQRTATVGPTTDLNQVIIKNTQAVKEALDGTSTASLQIPRSQSVATPSHVQTLAPRRADRVRLEGFLSDVWTRDVLPYPGMQPRRSDPIRAGANHVIRKFSMASITSNFSTSRRSAGSASHSSISQVIKEDLRPPKHKKNSRNSHAVPSTQVRPPLVDFHNAPEAFLPADFELHGPTAQRKKSPSPFRTLTMSIERPFSPLLGGESRSTSGLRRAQSVRDSGRTTTPAPPPEAEKEQPGTSVYTVMHDRVRTPSRMQPSDETVTADDSNTWEPRKSKSRNKLRRFFG